MRGRRKPSYAGAFLLTVIGVVAATAFTIWLMRPATAAEKDHLGVLALEVGDGFAVRNVANIRPLPESYAPFADEDRRWRERSIARMMAAMRTEGPGAAWKPSAEQILDDSVYFLSGTGRFAEAAALLEAWLAAHPDDIERVITTARLLGQTDKLDASFAMYSRAVAVRIGDRALRREYADALLYSGRYAMAVEQFSLLLAMDDGDRGVRLGLARALAWNNRSAEAEPLLTRLWNEQPADTTLRALLRATRANIEPSSRVVLEWLAGDDGFWPYRLALARAYGREGRFAAAAAAFDDVLADSAPLSLLTEAAGTHAAAGDSVGTAALLGRALALAPEDASLRRQHAEALAWSGDRHGAIAEYTRLLAVRDDGELRLARGLLYLYLDDEPAALADLERSAKLQPSYTALAAIGDLYRWRGDLPRAREAYSRALALQPADARVLAGLALVRIAERAALAQRNVTDDQGWNLSGSYAEDNVGYLILGTRLAYGFSPMRATTASIGAEQRRISQRSAGSPERFVYGYSVDAALQHHFNRLQVGIGGGLARHALVPDMAFGHASVSLPLGRTVFSLRTSTGPAYSELWSLWTLVRAGQPEAEPEAPMRARRVMASATVPVGRATVEVGAERMSLGDGNKRTSVNVAVRQPVSRSLRVLYSAGQLGWNAEGASYWDPRSYTQHAVGVEYGRTVSSNLTVAARALGGIARASERVLVAPGTASLGSSWSPQFSTSVDATYRGGTFEITAGGGYGHGAPRAGGLPGYQSLNGTLRVRIDWP